MTPEPQATPIGLAERCEAASEPDRELDVEIWLACVPGTTRREISYFHKATGRECTTNETREASGRMVIVPAYTASLDAAMTLVDRYGVLLHLSDIKADGLPMCIIGDSATAREFKGIGTANLALALCAAALRARAAS